ncbi:unnamed protein product [Lota lota]
MDRVARVTFSRLKSVDICVGAGAGHGRRPNKMEETAASGARGRVHTAGSETFHLQEEKTTSVTTFWDLERFIGNEETKPAASGEGWRGCWLFRIKKLMGWGRPARNAPHDATPRAALYGDEISHHAPGRGVMLGLIMKRTRSNVNTFCLSGER